MATLYKADKDSLPVEGIKGTGTDGRFTLQQLQDAVGGYIEGIPGTNNRAWCNEEGLLLGLEMNTIASLMFGQQLVGDVLVMDDEDKYEGEEEEAS